MVVRELGEESGTPTAVADAPSIAAVDKPVSEDNSGDAGSGSADAPVVDVDSGTDDDVMDKVSEEVSKGSEAPEGDASKKDFYVGTYKTKRDAEEGLRLKEDALARERSRADSSLDKFNKLSNQLESKYNIDTSGNIVSTKPPPPPTKSKDELMEAATLGDKTAMDELLRMNQMETLQAVQAMTATDRKRYDVMEKYPELKDTKSSLFRETDTIVRSNRLLNNVEGVEIAVQLAQKNLLDRELPKIKQKAVDGAHRSIAKKGANSVESPGTSVTEREAENLSSLLGENHEEKLSWVKKLGGSSNKVVERLKKQKKGGRYL